MPKTVGAGVHWFGFSLGSAVEVQLRVGPDSKVQAPSHLHKRVCSGTLLGEAGKLGQAGGATGRFWKPRHVPDRQKLIKAS